MSDDEVSTPSVIRKGDGSPVRSALKGNRKTQDLKTESNSVS